ncbi:MAG: PCP reductase family protein, partial [Burkholderiaceae bacterium]
AQCAPTSPQDQPHWQAAALARLARVPQGFMREASRQRIEAQARQRGADSVTLGLVEGELAIARGAMADQAAVHDSGAAASTQPQGKCPFSRIANPSFAQPPPARAPSWTAQARARLQAVPAGFCRTLTERAVDTLAGQNDRQEVDLDFVQSVLQVFENGSRSIDTAMPWAADARARIERAPEVVRGMLVREIEAWAQRHARAEVDEDAVRAVKREWRARGVFHLDPEDPRRDA